MDDVTRERTDGEELCGWIRSAEQALMAHHEAVLRRYGLTMAQYLVLLALSRTPRQSGSQLARVCGVTQQTMASVVKGLEGKDLVAREVSEIHAKVQLVSVTDDGLAALDAAYQEVGALQRSFGSAFSEKERRDLRTLLERATAVLVEQTVAP